MKSIAVSGLQADAPHLSVVIVSYRCRSLLVRCLDSLAQTYSAAALDLIVVDNASDDGTVEAIRSSYPAVRLIANRENVGFPIANNQALAIARSEHILLLNPDTVVTDGAIDSLIEFLKQEPRDKVVGLKIRNIDGSFQPTVRGVLPTALGFIAEQIPIPRPRGDRERRKSEAHFASVKTVQSVGSVSGAALASTRAVFNRLGFLDESMFWAEDLDFCYRAARAGIPVFYFPSSIVLHYGGESGKKNYARMIYSQHSSRIVFARKHYGKGAELALRSAFAVMLPAKIGVRALQMLLPKHRQENAQRLVGYWNALRECFVSAGVNERRG